MDASTSSGFCKTALRTIDRLFAERLAGGQLFPFDFFISVDLNKRQIGVLRVGTLKAMPMMD